MRLVDLPLLNYEILGYFLGQIYQISQSKTVFISFTLTPPPIALSSDFSDYLRLTGDNTAIFLWNSQSTNVPLSNAAPTWEAIRAH